MSFKNCVFVALADSDGTVEKFKTGGSKDGRDQSRPVSRRRDRWLRSSIQRGLAIAFGIAGAALVTEKVSAAAPVFSYLISSSSPVQPSSVASFKVTVKNLTDVSQFANFVFNVPNFTTFDGAEAGSPKNLYFGNIDPGAVVSRDLDLKVLGGNISPPDGSVIQLFLEDENHGVTLSRSIVIQSLPRATLSIATEQSTVAPGFPLFYTLAYNNTSGATLKAMQLYLQIPSGAAFKSADNGGFLAFGGIVRWKIGEVAPGGSGEVRVFLKCRNYPVNAPPLLVKAALADSGVTLVQVTDVKAVYSIPTFAFALTTTTDPAEPGQKAHFKITATNLTETTQFTRFYYHVPQYTTYQEDAAGTLEQAYFGNIAPGESQSRYVDLDVNGGNASPAGGSVVNLSLDELDNGASLAQSVIVRSQPTAFLSLSTSQGTVVPGGVFSYTLNYQNTGSSDLTGVQLTLPVPKNAGFVSADEGGKLGVDGVVRWKLGLIAAGSNGQVQVALRAPAPSAAHPGLLMQAKMLNPTGLLAQASDFKAMYAAPLFSYSLTTATDPAEPGLTAHFKVAVTNLTDSTQFVRFYFHVPRYTTYERDPEGALEQAYFGNVAAGATESRYVDLTVDGGNASPPDGSIITLVLDDQDNGTSLARSAVVRADPPAVLDLSTSAGSVGSGGVFLYALAYHNSSGRNLAGVQLRLPLPPGVTYLSADGGGVSASGGVVLWSLGTLGAGAAGEVHVKLKAPFSTSSNPVIQLEASLSDATGHTLAEASDAKAVYNFPDFSYVLTTPNSSVQAGQSTSFTITVNNLTDSQQFVRFYFEVPRYTTYEGDSEGTVEQAYIGNVDAGASQSVNVNLTVTGGEFSPPNGSIITLGLDDFDRGMLISRSVGVNKTILALKDPQALKGNFKLAGLQLRESNLSYPLGYHLLAFGAYPTVLR